MDFSIVGALVAGFVGTAIVSMVMKMSGNMGDRYAPDGAGYGADDVR